MENRKAQSFKPLTISAENLPASMARQEASTSYAAMRAKILLGCYRTGDANDPETYVAAITAILARYPEVVITAVTHPVTGLPSKKGWLPTVKEVCDACDEAVEPIVQNELRLKRIKEQLETREREERGEKPTLDQLREKFGGNWGLRRSEKEKAPEINVEENRAEMERQQARVRAEYEHLGMQPPSRLALSPTALREMAERDATRNQLLERSNTDAA
jgi:hypothetical protein